MKEQSGLVLTRSSAILVAAALLSIGAASMYVSIGMIRRPAAGVTITTSRQDVAAAPPASTTPAGGDMPLSDVSIPLTADAVKRAGIVVGRVSVGAGGSNLRLPGIVAPNAYRQVVVTPLVSGRITSVSVQLGDRVRKGQTLAQVYSPELADARTRYVSAVAMLEAHDRERQRTEKLVKIGAASQQELERIHAEHAAQTSAVESARAQLELLGGNAIPAPIDGVVTERSANVGLNVVPATALFTVVDLSTVWVIADVPERDMSHVHVGTDARITAAALFESEQTGRVSYIDPRVDATTRTAKARIELRNLSGALRLGMYVDVAVAAPTTGLTIPAAAVQNVGDRTVVYVADPQRPDTFVEREVRLGETRGDDVEVIAGIQAGDLVVTAGSFSLRAERERLGLNPHRH